MHESALIKRWLMSEFRNLIKLQLKILSSYNTHSNLTTSNLFFYHKLSRGVCRISQGGGPNFKISGIWDIRELFARGVWGHAPPKKIFKNGAISCVLRAIFNHFHGKKSSQKIINKHKFFH